MPNFRHRLPRSQQKVYDRSNSIPAIPLRVSPRLGRAAELLVQHLADGQQPMVERLAQAISDEICLALQVPGVKVRVRGTRPSNARGELHGLYSPGPRQDRIEVWMITAKRGQVVAFKTFLRTLLHEICHHLDYELLRLSSSLHTDGFFKRESSLFAQVVRQTPEIGAPGGGGDGRGRLEMQTRARSARL
jgi:hypothetical protein